jgi:hypothetical protein
MDNLVHIIVPIRKEIATTLHKIVGTIAPRKKGQGGRGLGLGGHANAGKVKRGNKVSRAPIYPLKAHGAETPFPDERFVAIALYQRKNPRYW